MELVTKEIFDRLVIEAATELDFETEQYVKEQIKRHMREVTHQEARLNLLSDMDKLRERINRDVSGENYHNLMGISPSVPHMGCR